VEGRHDGSMQGCIAAYTLWPSLVRCFLYPAARPSNVCRTPPLKPTSVGAGHVTALQAELSDAQAALVVTQRQAEEKTAALEQVGHARLPAQAGSPRMPLSNLGSGACRGNMLDADIKV